MRLASMRGGVEIPKQERPWAKKLTADFDNLPPEVQGSIISIISEVRKSDPTKAVEIAREIGVFFSHVGDYAEETNMSIQEFLDKIWQDLEKSRKKHIN